MSRGRLALLAWLAGGLVLETLAQPSPSIVCNQDYYNATRYLGARNSARTTDGTIAVVFEPASNYFNQDIWYVTWNPFFEEWDPAQQLSFSPQGYTGVPAIVADDDGHMWAGWKQQNQDGDRDMAACYWDGFSWGTPVVADTIENNAGVGAIDLADDGTVFNLFSIWNDPPVYHPNIYSSWSRDGGQTWVTQNLTSEFPTPDYLPLNYLDVALAPGLNGEMWAAWEDKPYDASWEIMLSHFDGDSWSTPEVVSPIEDIEGILKYVDGCTPAPGSQAVYTMGPDDYVLAGNPTAVLNPDQGHPVLSCFFNLRYISADAGRDEMVADVINYFGAQNILLVDDDNRYDHETYFQEALEAGGFTYTTFDCGADTAGVEQIPTMADLAPSDLVIWFCGDDGGNLAFWNGADEDNPALSEYLENGGKLWVMGLDFLYDRYGAAPVDFAPGDFVYDYLGLASYDVQSWVDDDHAGLSEMEVVAGNPVTEVGPIHWLTTGAIRQGEPSIATTPDGVLHMAYVQEGHIYYWNFDGEQWSEPVQVDASPDSLDTYRPNIATDPDYGVYVTWNEVQAPQPRLTNIFYAVSPDGGQTWQEPVQLSQATYSNDYGNSVFKATIGRKVRPEIPGVFPGGADVIWVQYNADSDLGYDVMYGRIPYAGAGNGVSERSTLPARLGLLEAYPNPFNPATEISFRLTRPGPAQLRIYDLGGRLVTELCSGYLAAGKQYFTWNAENQASGIYLAVLKSGDERLVRKITLLK